jgi:hypothetical protein
MKGSVPGPILNYISKQALKQATAWVKKESEANPTLKVPNHLGAGAGLPTSVRGGSTITSTSSSSSCDANGLSKLPSSFSTVAGGLFGGTNLPKWGGFRNLLPRRKLQ